MMAIFLSLSYGQKTYNERQQAILVSILSFLKDEGFQPSLDNDGDIRFKRQGDTFYIDVSDSDDSPYYVKMLKFFKYSKDITKADITMYSKEILRYKMIKLTINDNNYVIKAEMFINNSNSFTSIFYRLLSAFDAAEKDIARKFL